MKKILLFTVILACGLFAASFADNASPASGDTVLYYIPGVSQFYHADPDCHAVSMTHRPLPASFTLAEANNDAYISLKPCKACGAPKRLPAQAAAAEATTTPAEKFRYTLNSNGTATITGVDDNLSEAVIPAELYGHKVTVISYGTFDKCRQMSAIKLPEGVESIGSWAFANCTELRTINIPDSVKEIGETAFTACWSLESIDISPAHPVFEKINNLLVSKRDNTVLTHTTVYYDVCDIPAGITRIGEDAFSNSKMSRVIIPDTVKEIATCAFDECRNLEEVVIPDSVKEIGSQAFMGCHSLKSISIPAGTTLIGDAVFNDCYHLTSIEVSPDNPVYEAHDLLLIKKDSQGIISASCAIEGQYVIPDGIMEIGSLAFQGCYNLKEVTIPASVTYIDSDAFNAINNLVIKAPAGSYAQKFCEKNNIRFVELENDANG